MRDNHDWNTGYSIGIREKGKGEGLVLKPRFNTRIDLLVRNIVYENKRFVPYLPNGSVCCKLLGERRKNSKRNGLWMFLKLGA